MEWSPEQQIFIKYRDDRTDVVTYGSFIDLMNEMEQCQNVRNEKKKNQWIFQKKE